MAYKRVKRCCSFRKLKETISCRRAPTVVNFHHPNAHVKCLYSKINVINVEGIPCIAGWEVSQIFLCKVLFPSMFLMRFQGRSCFSDFFPSASERNGGNCYYSWTLFIVFLPVHFILGKWQTLFAPLVQGHPRRHFRDMALHHLPARSPAPSWRLKHEAAKLQGQRGHWHEPNGGRRYSSCPCSSISLPLAFILSTS